MFELGVEPRIRVQSKKSMFSNCIHPHISVSKLQVDVYTGVAEIDRIRKAVLSS